MSRSSHKPLFYAYRPTWGYGLFYDAQLKQPILCKKHNVNVSVSGQAGQHFLCNSLDTPMHYIKLDGDYELVIMKVDSKDPNDEGVM